MASIPPASAKDIRFEICVGMSIVVFFIVEIVTIVVVGAILSGDPSALVVVMGLLSVLAPIGLWMLFLICLGLRRNGELDAYRREVSLIATECWTRFLHFLGYIKRNISRLLNSKFFTDPECFNARMLSLALTLALPYGFMAFCFLGHMVCVAIMTAIAFNLCTATLYYLHVSRDIKTNIARLFNYPFFANSEYRGARMLSLTLITVTAFGLMGPLFPARLMFFTYRATTTFTYYVAVLDFVSDCAITATLWTIVILVRLVLRLLRLLTIACVLAICLGILWRILQQTDVLAVWNKVANDIVRCLEQFRIELSSNTLEQAPQRALSQLKRFSSECTTTLQGAFSDADTSTSQPHDCSRTDDAATATAASPPYVRMHSRDNDPLHREMEKLRESLKTIHERIAKQEAVANTEATSSQPHNHSRMDKSTTGITALGSEDIRSNFPRHSSDSKQAAKEARGIGEVIANNDEDEDSTWFAEQSESDGYSAVSEQDGVCQSEKPLPQYLLNRCTCARYV